MIEWRPFDIKSFLKASRNWDEDIKKLQEEHDNIPLLPASGNATVRQKGNVSDLTSKAALRRLEIASHIEEIMLYKEMLAFVLKTLSDDEKELIDGFYYPKKSIGAFVYEYGKSHGLSERSVYEERARIEKKMGLLILSKYYDE